jgi:hypothetical protein
VDDLLIICNENKRDIENLLNCFNNLNPKLNFTKEKVTKRSISFLYITIHREENNFSVDRKPTYTDSIIPNDSYHPTEHKDAATATARSSLFAVKYQSIFPLSSTLTITWRNPSPMWSKLTRGK